MKPYEKTLLVVLYSVFFILLFLLWFPSLYLGFIEGIIFASFYILGISVPIYFLILFIKTRTFRQFKMVIVASVPMITFIIIMLILLIQLGEALEHF